MKYCLNKIPLAMYVKPGVAFSFIVHTKVSKTYLKKKFKDKKKKSIQSFVKSCCRSQCLHIVVRTIQVLFKKKLCSPKEKIISHHLKLHFCLLNQLNEFPYLYNIHCVYNGINFCKSKRVLNYNNLWQVLHNISSMIFDRESLVGKLTWKEKNH